MSEINNKFWTKLENDIHQTIPDAIKYILARSGYENRFGLQHITCEDISDIELHIEKTRNDG